MIHETVTVKNPSGLHARTSKKLVDRIQNFESDVTLRHDDVEADGNSIMEILMLAASPGTEIEISVSGVDEDDAIESLINFFEEEHSSGENL